MSEKHKKLAKDEQTLQRLDKIEVAMLMLLEDLREKGCLDPGMKEILSRMISNRD